VFGRGLCGTAERVDPPEDVPLGRDAYKGLDIRSASHVLGRGLCGTAERVDPPEDVPLGRDAYKGAIPDD